MSESLESLALEAAGNVDDGKAVAGLSELLRALACVCRERDALKRSGCACTPDFYLASYAGGESPGGIYSWVRMGLQSTTDAATSWVDYVPRSELESLRAQEPVAWMLPRDGDDCAVFREPSDFVKSGVRTIGWSPLYAAPQPPLVVERLTDEWLLDVAGSTLYLHHRPSVDRLVRACAAVWGVTLKEQQ